MPMRIYFSAFVFDASIEKKIFFPTEIGRRRVIDTSQFREIYIPWKLSGFYTCFERFIYSQQWANKWAGSKNKLWPLTIYYEKTYAPFSKQKCFCLYKKIFIWQLILKYNSQFNSDN